MVTTSNFIRFQPHEVELVTQYRDPEGTFDGIGHSSIVEIESNNATSIISVGPDYDFPGAKQSIFWTKGTNRWYTHANDGSSVWKQTLRVSKGTISRYADWLNHLEDANKLLYSVGISSCVTHTSIALNMSGIFNIGIHPFLLNAEMFLWNGGVRPWTYAYLLNL